MSEVGGHLFSSLFLLLLLLFDLHIFLKDATISTAFETPIAPSTSLLVPVGHDGCHISQQFLQGLVVAGYEVLIENLMDPAHLPYAHYGIMGTQSHKMKVDREGGRPLEMSINKLDVNGFTGKREWRSYNFIAPCVFRVFSDPVVNQGNRFQALAQTKKALPANRQISMIVLCVPVSPGNSRLIWTFPRNFGLWIDRIVPRWMFHIGQNLIIDSDLYILHVEERKIMDIGANNWQTVCFVPTKSDAFVVGFRTWLNKFAGSKIDWRGKFSGALPPSPPRQQLMDRYWSHVAKCKSCNTAYKALNALEVVLQVASIISIGIVAATKRGVMAMVTRTTLVSMAIICFAASRWLAHFIYRTFHFHDYNHAFR